MKAWLTAQELADAQIPGLPRTQRGVQKRALAESWANRVDRARPRAGQKGGGGLEYHIDVLSPAQRLAYLSQAVEAPTGSAFGTPAPQGGERDLSVTARRARDARLAILAGATQLKSRLGLTQSAADPLYCVAFNSGEARIDEWVREMVPRISPRSLARWRVGARQGSLGSDPAMNRKDTGVLTRGDDGRVRAFILGLIAKNQFFSAEHIRNAVVARFGASVDVGGRHLPVPGIRTFQGQLAAWRAEYRNELLKLQDPDAYRSRVEFVATGMSQASRLNEVWQVDASPLDAIMLSGKRQTIYAAIDVYSRRTILLLTPTPRASAVGVLIRKCLKAWGVPERIKTDNGSDFTAHATRRLLTSLGIEIELAPPYTPRAKAIVERVIGTFQRDFAATLPGFVGHNPGQRKIIEQRKAFSRRLGLDDAHLFDAALTEAEAAVYADRWAAEVYDRAPHNGLGGRSPFAVAAAAPGPVRRIADEASLDVLLAPVAGKDGRRQVTKTGIAVEGANYLIGTVMPGRQVFCRMDPTDLGRLFVFADDEETFLGHAICPTLAGLDPVEIAGRVRAQQRAFMDTRLKPIRSAMRKIGPRQVLDAQLDQAAAQSGTLVAFPSRVTPHTTVALESAAEAKRPVAPQPISDAIAAAHADLKAQLEADSVRDLHPADSAKGRFRRALDVERRLAAGEAVTPQEAHWLGGYQTGPEYRAQQKMLDDFGADAMSL